MAVSYVPDYLRVIREQTAAGAAAAANRNKTTKPTASQASFDRAVNPRANVFIPEFAPNRTSPAVVQQIVPVSKREETTTPVRQTATGGGGPVQVTTPAPTAVPQVTEPAPPPVQAPVVEEAAPAPEPTPYSVYDDPFYQQSLAAAQSQFNLARIDALAGNQYQERGINRQLQDRIPAAEQQRRRLAGNFAARGMAGGRYGALTRAEAETNARELTARTGLREQIAELNRQFVSRFGAEGTDWLGTRAGYESQQAAIQQALQNRLAGLTTVG